MALICFCIWFAGPQCNIFSIVDNKVVVLLHDGFVRALTSVMCMGSPDDLSTFLVQHKISIPLHIQVKPTIVADEFFPLKEGLPIETFVRKATH